MLDIKGSLVTIDALGCQTAIAQKIVDRAADYVLACKGNQERLHRDVENLFTSLFASSQSANVLDYFKTTNEGHGRREVREVWRTSDLDTIRDRSRWANLQSVALVRSERCVAGETTVETRLYISRAAPNAERLANAIRSHWGIENQVHWVLDMVFADDYRRARIDHSAHNMVIIRHIVRNLLRQETSLTTSLRQKRLRAAWDDSYVRKVLNVELERVEQM